MVDDHIRGLLIDRLRLDLDNLLLCNDGLHVLVLLWREDLLRILSDLGFVQLVSGHLPLHHLDGAFGAAMCSPM